jgi:hypothetical protein
MCPFLPKTDRRKLIQYSAEAQHQNFEPNIGKWFEKHKPTVLKTLRTAPFFGRFSLNRQIEIMKKMKVKPYQRDTLLFFEPNDVNVVVSGSILMESNERNTMLPQTGAKCTEVDILNFHQEGSDVFYSVDTWSLCQVDTEVAIFNKHYY